VFMIVRVDTIFRYVVMGSAPLLTVWCRITWAHQICHQACSDPTWEQSPISLFQFRISRLLFPKVLLNFRGSVDQWSKVMQALHKYVLWHSKD
jgi:hypothetical protein